MRRALLLAAVLGSLVPAGSAAAAAPPTGGAEVRTTPGGAAFDPRAPRQAPLRIRSFELTAATVALRVDGPVRRVRLRLDVLPAGSRTVARRVRFGSRRTGRRVRIRWTPELTPGAYVARLYATTPGGRRARRPARTRLAIAAPPPPPPPPAAFAPGFPAQGAFTFGGDGARFGAVRPGHAHQGQDVVAALGTPLVTPVAGVVHWRAFEAAGAGHYLVIRSPGLGDHVYMHLREGSLTVAKGAAVTAGQRIAEVGSTGRSSGPHLHFELWPGGWREPGSQPVDPRPQLDAWAAGR